MVVRTEDTRDNYNYFANLLSADILYFTKSNKNKIKILQLNTLFACTIIFYQPSKWYLRSVPILHRA